MDHKDHFEHLRTVHFSLVITCLGLLVVSTTSQDRTIAAAESQLRTLQTVVLHWKDIDFDSAIDRQIKTTDNPLPKNRTIQVDGKHRYAVRFVQPAWAPPSSETCSPWLFDPMIHRVPRTLSEVREVWNCLEASSSFAIPFAFSADAGIVDGRKVPLPTAPSSPTTETLEFAFGKTDEDQRSKIRQAFGVSVDYAFGSVAYAEDGSSKRILIPLEKARFVTVDLTEPLRALDSSFENRTGPYEKAFPELNELTADYSDLTFDKLSSILASQRKHSVQTFEAFSVKFPSEAIARWGVVLLLGIQLYLLIHLQSLKLEPAEDLQIAWIPLYAAVLPQIVFVFSVLLLPVFTCYSVSRLGTIAGSAFWNGFLFILAIVASILLGTKTIQVFAMRFRGPVPAWLLRTRLFGKPHSQKGPLQQEQQKRTTTEKRGEQTPSKAR
jgi:hypothetical protein